MSLSVHIKKDFGGFLLSVDLEHESGIMGLLGASGAVPGGQKRKTAQCIIMVFYRRQDQIPDLHAERLILKHFPDPADMIPVTMSDKNIIQNVRRTA